MLQIRVAEQEGIVFIDEIDKIVNPSGMIRHGESGRRLCLPTPMVLNNQRQAVSIMSHRTGSLHLVHRVLVRNCEWPAQTLVVCASVPAKQNACSVVT